MCAVDFFSVETIWLQRLYVLFFIDPIEHFSSIQLNADARQSC
jgi:hypothetical protein